MSLFKKLFGQGHPLSSLRKALDQRRWADAAGIGNSLDRSSLGPDDARELDRLLDAAGDGLAELNLLEGEGCLRGGDRARAAEHFALAASQVRSDDIARRIACAREELSAAGAPASVASPKAPVCGSDCCDGGKAVPADAEISADLHLDESTRLELVLGSYPPGMATACLQGSDLFRKAFLLAHEGREKEAAELFDAIPRDEWNDLYHFEFGAVLGRLGESERACRELEAALELNPGNELALETLIALEIAGGKEAAAQKRLESILAEGGDPAFCHGALAIVLARLGDPGEAMRHGIEAVSAGNADPQVLLLTASLLERVGRAGEAEALLQRIPGGGGCSGGTSLPLAELWLRQGKNLDKVLEAFKGALRQEPDRTRWALRIAQTYIAKGWKREGMELLRNALARPGLEPELQREGTDLMNALNGGSP